MRFLKFSAGIFLLLSISRFVPHPPNFTNLIALSFYIPVLFGRKFIPIILLSFLITDLLIGMHNLTFFTWGSVVIIGIFSSFFKNSLKNRFFGVFLSSIIFFIISNFGVWLLGGYEYNLSGLALCYFMAIPFYSNTLISTIIYSILIEVVYFYFQKNFQFNKDFSN